MKTEYKRKVGKKNPTPNPKGKAKSEKYEPTAVNPLFDRLIEGIRYDLAKYENTTKTLSDDVVHYVDNRTGREAYMSVSRHFAITSLVPGLLKKYVGETRLFPHASSGDRARDAIQDFLDSNARCRVYNETSDPKTFDPFLDTVIGEVSVCLDNVFARCDDLLTLGSIAHNMRVGPGASADVPGSRTGTFLKILNGGISFSSILVYQMYRACTHVSPLTHSVETYRKGKFGVHDVFDSTAQFLSVLKTALKNRGICKQPSGNMVLQLAVNGDFQQVLIRCFDCDLETQQELNRHLALLGSYESFHMTKRTWEWCTLDLSEASNFPAILIKRLFPLRVARILSILRCRNIKVGGEIIEKHMMSTMGNGFTFSLMTLFLSAIVRVLYELADLPEFDTFVCDHSLGCRNSKLKTWGVYGDDIIVDKRVFEPLTKVLKALGFVINAGKSFSSGPFRESCGGDYHHGYEVRPVFVENLDNKHDIFSLINRLNDWSVKHSVPLPTGIRTLYDALSNEDQKIVVPNWEGVDAGIHAPLSCYSRPDLYSVPFPFREEWSPSGSDCKKVVYYESFQPVASKLTFFRERQSKPRRWSCVVTRREFEYTAVTDIAWFTENYLGILMGMLEGSVIEGRSGCRSFTTRYKKIWNLAPQWGDPSLFRDQSWLRPKKQPEVVLPIYANWAVRVSANLKGVDIIRTIDVIELYNQLALPSPCSQYENFVNSYILHRCRDLLGSIALSYFNQYTRSNREAGWVYGELI